MPPLPSLSADTSRIQPVVQTLHPKRMVFSQVIHTLSHNPEILPRPIPTGPSAESFPEFCRAYTKPLPNYTQISSEYSSIMYFTS